MFDENKYPTLRYMKCKKCGNVFVMSYSGSKECPECASDEADTFQPGEHPDVKKKSKPK